MNILVLPGDGIGPEVTSATLVLIEHINRVEGLGLRLDIRAVGLEALTKTGTTLPDDVRQRASEVDGIIMAPLSTYDYPSREDGGLNPSAEFRTGLHLYANIRPCKSRLSKTGRLAPIDLVLVRENTEGFYACRAMHSGTGEFMPDPQSAFALRKITSEASRAIAEAAFQLTLTRRSHVTVIHKANVLKISDGLFLRSVQDVACQFPGVTCTELLVDAAAALLIRSPEMFDVVLTSNMFGDILSNEAAEIAGGLGMAPSLNAGHRVAMAQAAHGSAPDIAGKGIANPSGLMLSAAMLLEWLGRTRLRTEFLTAARRAEDAIDRTLGCNATRTVDLGGTLSTSAFAEAVVKNYETGLLETRARMPMPPGKRRPSSPTVQNGKL